MKTSTINTKILGSFFFLTAKMASLSINLRWSKFKGKNCKELRSVVFQVGGEQNLKQPSFTASLSFWGSPFQPGIVLGNNDIRQYCVPQEGMSQLHAVVVLCWVRSAAWWSGQVSEVYGNMAVVQLTKRTLSFLFWGIKMCRIKSAQFMLYPSSLLSILKVNDEPVSVPKILSTMR